MNENLLKEIYEKPRRNMVKKVPPWLEKNGNGEEDEKKDAKKAAVKRRISKMAKGDKEKGKEKVQKGY